MSASTRGKAKTARRWAESLGPMQRRLFLAVARDVLHGLKGDEAADLQRRCDAIRKVSKALDDRGKLSQD